MIERSAHPRVERFGTEPIPAELRTHGTLDLFRILFMGNVNPVMMIFGALAVSVGGLPFWWAVTATTLGQGLAALSLIIAGQIGVDYGLSGQVGLRATFGLIGARVLTSPYRVVVSSYWFAAQAIAAALALHAIFSALTGVNVGVVPLAVTLGVGQAFLAVVGFHALRYFARVMLPMAFVFIAVIGYIFVSADNPAFSFSHVAASPGLSFTWGGFAAFVSILWAAAASNVTNVADLCRYTRSRRAMRLGVFLGSTLSVFAATSLGAYAAVATGTNDPFDALTRLPDVNVALIVLVAAVLAQSTAINVMNLYTAGLSLTNTVPRLGRTGATIAIGVVAATLAGFPSLVTEAHEWVRYLGTLSTPLAGVILADFVLRRRSGLDLPGLFDPHGPYRYWYGVNAGAVAAVAAAAITYSLVPPSLVKAAWGTLIGAFAYLAARLVCSLALKVFPRSRPASSKASR